MVGMNRFADVPKELLEDPVKFKAAMQKASDDAYEDGQLIAAAQFAVWRDLFYPIAEMGKSAALADFAVEEALQAATQHWLESERAAGREPDPSKGFDVSRDKHLNGMASLLGSGGTFAVKTRTLLDIIAQCIVNTCSSEVDELFLDQARRAIEAARAIKDGDIEGLEHSLGLAEGEIEECDLSDVSGERSAKLVIKGGKKPTIN